ncbi:MAG: glycoside hydrolase [Bacteroidales bacterium]|nr:glycoside hydrolase [Bacteroidales bacterium]
MKRLLLSLIALALFAAVACGPTKASIREKLDAAVDSTLASYSLDQKVWQLFMVGTQELEDSLCPVGGVILFGYDVKDSAQLRHLTDSLHALPGRPLISIDEEGGRVARIGRNKAFNVPRIPAMLELTSAKEAFEAGRTIGSYLSLYGLDIDFAPVADVSDNPLASAIGDRAFSSDPAVVAERVVQFAKGLAQEGICACVKHFPGHGDTSADTHYGYAQNPRTWEELLQRDMVPFKAAIDAGVPMVMTAHISAPAVTGTGVPSTLSPLMLTEKLRGELGYNGIIITDALRMGAIAREYPAGEAAVLALQAGVDILLLPGDFLAAHKAVMEAVEEGVITEERIDCSVRRILELKLSKHIH